jgi:putative sigma-54 modulation protein
MKLLIQGNNIEVTDAIHNYVKQKLEKAVKHFHNITTKVDVHLSVASHNRANDSHQAEVTVYANGTVIRAQETSENLYASIDMVADKIARQLRKYKEKNLYKKTHAHTNIRELEIIEQESLNDNLTSGKIPQLPQEVVRAKYFAMPPMTVEEALEQLQIIDHDFYMFCNSVTNEINVIYCRNHGGYGVIQPRPVENEFHYPHKDNSNGHHARVNHQEIPAIG